MKALITGANGQLGYELQRLFPEAIATDREELDITNPKAVSGFDWSDIGIIYNAAAFTDVDGAETNPEAAAAVNREAVANLAAAARDHDLTLVHFSTDFVFDGNASTPYAEDAPVHPGSIYGKTKAAGEKEAEKTPKHYLVRTSWVYGEGHNFVRTMMRLGETHDEVSVVSDQLGRPTYAKDLAAAAAALVKNQALFGVYHFQNSGEIISWADLATAIFKEAGMSCKVKPITSAEYAEGKSQVAPRPPYSALALDKIVAAGVQPRPWPVALNEFIKQELKT